MRLRGKKSSQEPIFEIINTLYSEKNQRMTKNFPNSFQ